jgi:hypothetical protein
MNKYFYKFGRSLDWPFNVSGRGKITDPFGDYDGDGLQNLNDCEPKNKKKQDTITYNDSSLKLLNPATVDSTGTIINKGDTNYKIGQQLVNILERAGSRAVIMPMPPKYTPMPIRPQPVPKTPIIQTKPIVPPLQPTTPKIEQKIPISKPIPKPIVTPGRPSPKPGEPSLPPGRVLISPGPKKEVPVYIKPTPWPIITKPVYIPRYVDSNGNTIRNPSTGKFDAGQIANTSSNARLSLDNESAISINKNNLTPVQQKAYEKIIPFSGNISASETKRLSEYNMKILRDANIIN